MTEDDKFDLLYYGCILLILICGIGFFVYSYQRSREQGASVGQALVTGKDLGSFCSSDVQCKSNRCIHDLCAL